VVADSGDADFVGALGGRVTSVSNQVAEGMGQRSRSAFAEGSRAADIRQILVQKGLDEVEPAAS
jgi:hypothetical protein